MKNSTFFIPLLFLVFSISGSVLSQPEHALLNDVVLPSPTIAALGEYVDMPVGYFTGVPNVGVPIHTLQEGPLSLPISLSYHAGGVKLATPTSWVGMGWSLRAGGVVSRVTRGLMDETIHGYYYRGKGLTGVDGQELNNAAAGQIDTEPDVFSFSFMGQSGKFYFDGYKENIVQLPQGDILIDEIIQEGKIAGFVFTNSDGTKYYFGLPSKESQLSPVAESTDILNGGASTVNPINLFSSWYLVKIESADGLYQIKFEYDNESYRYLSPGSSKESMLKYFVDGSELGRGPLGPIDCGISGSSVNFPQYTTASGGPVHDNLVKGKRVARIFTSTTELTFVAEGTRKDLISYTRPEESPKHLAKIVIKEGDGGNDFSSPSYCSEFRLRHDYVKGDPATYLTGLSASIDPLKSYRYRLRLKSVQQIACNDEATNTPSHTFEYYESGRKINSLAFFPSRLERGVDHWGFYNGQTRNNSTLLQAPRTLINVYNPTIDYQAFYHCVGQADRNSSLDGPALLGTLKRHTYPTGGYTVYDMESNTASNLGQPRSKLRTVIDYANCDSYPARPGSASPCCATSTETFSERFTSKQDFLDTEFYIALAEVDKINDPQGLDILTCNGLAAIYLRIYDETNDKLVGRADVFINGLNSPSGYVKFRDGPLVNLTDTLEVNRNYRFQVSVYGAKGVFQLNKRELFYPNAKDQPVGGLRVRKISAYDTINNSMIVKEFSYTTPTGQSSGRLTRQPSYATTTNFELNNTNVYFYEVKSSPIVPLGDFGGGHIGYGRVTVSSPGSGTTVHRQNNRVLYPDNPNMLPIPPAEPDFLRGKPQKSTFLDGQGDTIMTTDNTYSDRREPVIGGSGVPIIAYTFHKLPTPLSPPEGGPCGGAALRFQPLVRQYYLYKGRADKRSVETIRDDVWTREEFKYEAINHTYVTSKRTVNSNGQHTTVKYKYPNDFSSVVYEDMEHRNMLYSIASETFVSDPGVMNSEKVDGTTKNYKFFDGFPRLGSIERYEATPNAGGVWTGKDSLQGTINQYEMGYPSSFSPTGWTSPITFQYNPTSGLVERKVFQDFTWSYEYQGEDTRMVSRATGIDGQSIEYLYDDLLRLKTKKARLGKVTTDFVYSYHNQDNDRPGNYVKTTTTYDNTQAQGSELNTQTSYVYLDGLGRQYGSVREKHSDEATPRDIVAGTSYDPSGRPRKVFEPTKSAYSDGRMIDVTSSPHTTTLYYDDPLGRVKSTSLPSWDYPTSTNYGHNTSTLTAPQGDAYEAGSLFKVTVTDPNGNKTETYSDKLGRMILSRQVAENNKNYDTWYLYDKKGRTVQVYPPGATAGTPDLNYVYDYYGDDLIKTKKVPDQGVTSFWYDHRNLVTYTQDANMADGNKALHTHYDSYGRTLRVGFVKGTPTEGAAVADLDYALSTMCYDGCKENGAPASIYLGKLQHTMTRVLGTDDWLEETVHYDPFGRVERTEGNNTLNLAFNQAESVAFKYDFADNLLEHRRDHFTASGTTPLQIVAQDTYDHASRVKTMSQRIGATDLKVAKLFYTPKDQVALKYLGHSNGQWLQHLNYDYLDNGYLKAINALEMNDEDYIDSDDCTGPAIPTGGNAESDPARNDLFFLELFYNTTPGIGTSTVPQRNGNISGYSWRARGRMPQYYAFEYDALNRLTSSDHSEILDSGGGAAYDSYNTNYSYDERGNIRSLNRRGKVRNDEGCLETGEIDQLAYTYDSGTNRVRMIVDNVDDSGPTNFKNGGFAKSASAISSLTYEYDANGNMIYDPNKDLTIYYNYLNLPERFEFADCRMIDITYDAAGQKLREEKRNGFVTVSERTYLDGIEYVNGQLETVAHPEGRTYFGDSLPRQEFFIKDHLGNLRVSFSDLNSNGRVDLTAERETNEVLQEKNYYPFGMEMTGGWLDDLGRGSRYRYNGKELNEELGLYDYGARWYDPAVARWNAVDPLADKYQAWSPYNYTMNNPIRFIDPNGKSVASPDDWVVTSSGALVHNSAVTDRASAQEIYGADASYVGESALLQDGEGNQISLNKDGTSTESVFLDVVEVNAQSPNDMNAVELADGIATPVGLAADGTEAMATTAVALSGQASGFTEGLSTIGKVVSAIGKAASGIGIAKSASDFRAKSSIGNGVKLGYDVAASRAVTNPYAAVAVGVIDVTGGKDAAAKGIDRAVGSTSYRIWKNEQKVNVKLKPE